MGHSVKIAELFVSCEKKRGEQPSVCVSTVTSLIK